MNNKFSLRDKNLHVVEKRRIWFMIPVIIVLIALIEFFAFAGVNNWDFSEGLNIGIDFTGGTQITVALGDNYSEAKLNEVTSVVNGHGVTVSYAQKTGTGSSSAALVKFKNLYSDNEQNNNLVADITTDLEQHFGVEVAASSVGSTASGDLLATAFLSIFVAAICIFIYIIFRFELWSGLSAVIALFHDLIIMFSLTLICRIEINASFIAALITILAYSINDTIVIFDRIREYVKDNIGNRIDYSEIANHAIASSMTRSIYTSITTLLTIAIVAICIPQIRNFAFPIIFGILAGTFSSIFIAAPLYVSIKNSLANSKKAKAEKAFALANGREYVQENDYEKKSQMWANVKSKFGGSSKPQKRVENVSSYTESSDASALGNNETVAQTKPKKKPQQKFVNPKKKKKNK